MIFSAASVSFAAEVKFDATLSVDEQNVSFVPTAFTTDWQMNVASGNYSSPHGEGLPLDFKLKVNDERIHGAATFEKQQDGSLLATYHFTPEKTFALSTLCLQGTLPGETYFGGKMEADGSTLALPATRDKTQLFCKPVSDLKITGAKNHEFSLHFDTPVTLLLQDNREWNTETLSLRLIVADGKVNGGETYTLAFSIATSAPLDLHAVAGPVSLAASEDWIPVREYPDILPGSPLDFSQISGLDAPAGKYGYVLARGQNFEFEKRPGVPQRFYGVNFCFGANFLSEDEAEQLAVRLSRLGYNAIRIHHYERMLTEGSPDGTALNEKRLAEFDNLVAACIRHGLYITTDLYVSRNVPWRTIGIDRDGNIPMSDFKHLVLVNQAAFDNLKEFSRLLLTHVNPHTGRSYAEEPALAWISLVNEGNPGNFGSREFSSNAEWTAAWQEWLKQKKTVAPEKFGEISTSIPADLWTRNKESAAFSLFLMEKEYAFAAKLKKYLREELRCRALVTDMNSWMNPVSYQIPRNEIYDYVDDHFYIDHPQFLETPWALPSSCPNTNPFRNGNRGAQGVVFTRLLDKPYTITEYNYSAPGKYRGVGGIATGATAALQNWAGVWRFAWAHGRADSVHPEKARLDYFNIAGDPLSLAAERASICLYLRRDIEPHDKTCALLIPPADIKDFSGYDPHLKPAYAWLAWYFKIGGLVTDTPPADCFRSEVYSTLLKKNEDEIVRGTFGESKNPGDFPSPVAVDAQSGTFTIASERTCGGFADSGTFTAGPFAADIGTVPATVWASSLDGKPLAESAKILVTHLTDVQNTDIKYADQDLRVLLDWGHLPHIMRNGKADISLTFAGKGDFTVYALAANGEKKEKIDARLDGSTLRFTADVARNKSEATYLYLIVARRSKF